MVVNVNKKLEPRASDPRTWELAAPTIDASSSLCLPHSTNLWQSSEKEAMSWWVVWWGPPPPTFSGYCLELQGVLCSERQREPLHTLLVIMRVTVLNSNALYPISLEGISSVLL